MSCENKTDVVLAVKKLDSRAKLPSKAYADMEKYDAGYDLFALEDGKIEPGQRVMIRTGLAFAIPPGYYGRIAPRSGLALKHGIDILAGVVDANYRDEIRVIAINTTGGYDAQTKTFEYKAKDAIAQMIIEVAKNFPVKEVDTLDETTRNLQGFGSTDTRNH